jgi:pilus assembly protein CpaF
LVEPRAVQSELTRIKTELHRKVLEEIDLEQMDRVRRDTAMQETRRLIRTTLERENHPLTSTERDRMVQELLDELFGLGPLEPLLSDGSISDILVNGYGSVYIERKGKLEKTAIRFNDDEHLKRIIDRIVSRVGRRVDESSPMVDARLPDGSRVNAIIPPLSLGGPTLSIRRFGLDPLRASDLLANETLTPAMLELLQSAVKAKLNILISGGTGAGKTTLLNVLSAAIPDGERIISIEDAAELQLLQEHVVRLETRPPNVEGKGAVRQRELVINALRMRPDRIIVGEVRGEEAMDMLQAMNTGHEGSLTTIHSNSPRDALARLETMVAMAGLQLPDKAIRQQISSAMEVVVQITRLSDGTRKVTNIAEITGMEGPVVTMQDLFVHKRFGIDERGRVRGEFQPSGVRPKFTEKVLAAGYELPPELFSTERIREMRR